MRPSLKLPEGTVVLDVADACRDALEDFLAIDPNDKHALSRWLIGPYRRATLFAPRSLSMGGREAHAVSPISVTEIVDHAQREINGAIDAAAEPGAERLLARIPDVIDVIPVHDVHGGRGFAPQDVPHARLATRVLALLLADYLTRPDDYVARRGPGRPRRPSVRMLALA
jgi:hypothetical protein